MDATVRTIDRVEVSYDPDGDVLYLSIGKPHAALTRGEANGLLVRIDPQTHQAVGLIAPSNNLFLMSSSSS